MTKEQSIKQLKINLERLKGYRITHDQGEKFERLCKCFESIAKLEIKPSWPQEKQMIDALKKDPNEIKAVFHRMLKNDSFLEDLQSLKTYSPIKNNTRNKEISINDETDFSTIINVIYYAIRHPVTHGTEEYTERRKKIIRIVNRIFEKIVLGARLKYLS